MLDFVAPLRPRLSYAYIVAGVAWLGALVATSSLLIVWPAAACILGGLLWWTRPKNRLSWAWVTAAAAMGFVLSGYQVLVSAFLLTGTFAEVNAISLLAFLFFAAFHAVLLYTGNSGEEQAE